jgi:hypothetical protein
MRLQNEATGGSRQQPTAMNSLNAFRTVLAPRDRAAQR